METTKQTFIKPKNLNLINNNKIEGSKFFAYLRLLDRKGSEIKSGKLKGGKALYLGGQDFIGAKVTKYEFGYKLESFNAILNN